MKSITCSLPDSLYEAVLERMQTDKASCDPVVAARISTERMPGKPEIFRARSRC